MSYAGWKSATSFITHSGLLRTGNFLSPGVMIGGTALPTHILYCICDEMFLHVLFNRHQNEEIFPLLKHSFCRHFCSVLHKFGGLGLYKEVTNFLNHICKMTCTEACCSTCWQLSFRRSRKKLLGQCGVLGREKRYLLWTVCRCRHSFSDQSL